MPLFMFINPVVMHLSIAPDRKISEIQKEFNDVFQFLKLEFFNNKSFARKNFTSSQIIPNTRKLSDGLLGIVKDTIKIDQDMKVSDLENLFRDKFRLAVQVFRKSGNLWLETTMTDDWTLLQQNNHGREISTIKKNTPDPEDYDLNRDANH